MYIFARFSNEKGAPVPIIMTMEDITDYFINLLNEHQSLDIAESEFKRAIAEDEDLRAEYREWCHQEGNNEKNGFIDFCREYLEDRNEIWESLNDYDE